MPIVKMPDGTQVRFPDDMPREQIRDMIASKFPDVARQAAPQAAADNAYLSDLPVPDTFPEQAAPLRAPPETGLEGNAQQFLSGANEGIGSLLSLPNSIEMGARSVGPMIGNALGGNFAMPEQSWLPDAGAHYNAAAQDLGAIKPETSDPMDQGLRRVGQEVGANLLPWLGMPGKVAGAVSTLGSGIGAATMQRIAPDNPTAEIIGQLIGGGTPLFAANQAERAGMIKAATPTVEGLKADAGALYDQARASGVVAPQHATANLNQTMKGIATSEGLITPTGRVNSSYPRINGVLNTFEDFSNGTMNIAQAQAARKVLTDAAKSAEPGEKRIATMMLDEFDKFLNPLAPEISQANAIYSRAKKGELIEQVVELAGSRAGQFSGSGFENALRTEFRSLERQIIKGQMRGLSDAEKEAITKVAQGGPIENALRYVGKLAPTGVVSMGMGGGLPFMVGNAFGGPAMGAAAGATTMGAGMLARDAATKATAGNARQAVIEALTGGKAPTAPILAPETAGVASYLLSGQAANQNDPSVMSKEIARLLALN